MKVLEEISARQNLPIGWVATALQQVGLSVALLLNVYDRLFKAKVCLSMQCTSEVFLFL